MSDLIEAWVLVECYVVLQDLTPTLLLPNFLL